MNLPLPRLSSAALCLILAATLAGAVSCKRQETTAYNAPKEANQAVGDLSSAGAAPSAHADGSPLDATTPKPGATRPLPRLSWKLPEGWSETGPGQMSVASFAIKNDAGQATVSVTPLPNLAGQEAMIVNMWREQAGAPPLSEEETGSALTSVMVAGQPGKLFEIAAARGEKTTRIITAILNRADGTWFFKLAGDDAAVTAQKPAFVDFIKTVEFSDKGETAATSAPIEPLAGSQSPPATPAVKPTSALPAPEGWRALPAGQMQVAKFAVPEQGEAKAEVAVSMFSSDTGGTNSNVARWRRQLGLPDLPEAELSALPQPLDPSLPGAVVADLQHEKQRMVGAIVPRGGSWWFYKLMGDEAAVAAARESFLNFAKVPPKS